MENKFKYPILYSFRRCPYAIRARLAIKTSGIKVELREIKLQCKPKAFLNISPKGTVPLLHLSKGKILDESLDIMEWALKINDPLNWLSTTELDNIRTFKLLNQLEKEFKMNLDKYKIQVIANTSFNISSDPMVYDKEDAFLAVERMGIKYLLTETGLYKRK